MAENYDEHFQALSDSVVEMDEDRTRQLSEEAVAKGIDAYAAIDRGLVDGMNAGRPVV